MTHQLVYSSESTIPMQAEDLRELLAQARRKNGIDGISGALVYTDGIFLQIIEGERATVQALMARILKDLRHENVAILREGEVPFPRFESWKMAYVSATREQVARWAGIDVGGPSEADDGAADERVADERDRTARFVNDILALLTPEPPAESLPT